MDSMTLIAIVSIITAGVTIGLGSIAPALGEGRAVSTALTSLAQQPDASQHHHADLVRGPGDDRIHRHLLPRGLDDPDLRQPVLAPRHRPSHRKVSHADQLVHRRRPGDQLPHPGVVVEAIPLQAHPPRHRRAREGDRRPARGRPRRRRPKRKKERDDFQHKNEAFDQERAALLKKATDEAKAERQRLLDEARKDADALRAKRQDALRNEQRNLSQRHHPLDPEGSLCHHAEDAGGPRRHEPRGTHGRGVRPPRLRALTGAAKEQLAAAFKTSNQHGERAQRVRSAAGTAGRDRKRGQGNLRPGRSGPVRDRAGTGQRHRTLHQRTEGGLEHRGLSRDAGKERRRTSARGSQARSQAGREAVQGRVKPSQRPKRKAEPKARPNTGLNRWPRPQRRANEQLAG